jgi:hypothetical protein
MAADRRRRRAPIRTSTGPAPIPTGWRGGPPGTGPSPTRLPGRGGSLPPAGKAQTPPLDPRRPPAASRPSLRPDAHPLMGSQPGVADAVGEQFAYQHTGVIQQRRGHVQIGKGIPHTRHDVRRRRNPHLHATPTVGCPCALLRPHGRHLILGLSPLPGPGASETTRATSSSATRLRPPSQRTASTRVSPQTQRHPTPATPPISLRR